MNALANFKKLFLWPLLTVFGLSACASLPSEQGFAQMLQSWQNADINQFLMQSGPPHRIDELPNGSKMYTFIKLQQQNTAVVLQAGFPVTGHDDFFYPEHYVSPVRRHSYFGFWMNAPVVVNSQPVITCSFSVTANQEQKIIASRYQGYGCKAQLNPPLTPVAPSTASAPFAHSNSSASATMSSLPN